MPKVIVFGSINMDIVTYVDDFPKPGETIFGSEVKYFHGGKGANQAVSCKRLGCETQIVASVGDDFFGKEMLNFLEKEGINTQNIQIQENEETGIAIITVSKNSQNSIIVVSGANNIWNENLLENVNIEKDDIIISQFEIPNEIILQAFKKAKKAGATTILNPAPIREIPKELIEYIDIIVLNEIELEEITGYDEKNINGALEKLKELGLKDIVITLGENGVYLCDYENNECKIEARKVDAIDTTGAGDCFIGGLVYGLLNQKSLKESAEFGNKAASISVTRKGACASIPSIDEVKMICK